ncbi:hypothetical protein [Streptomyces umbrinus]|uniref:hypothetical protein n=1 Tax=Streptomyces umbrinus TaxID=67370 RepID=UPI00342136F7
MGRLLDVWCEATVPYLSEAGKGMDGRMDARRAVKLLWSGLHGQFGLWRNVSDVSDASELDELRDALLFALFGRV